MGFLTGFGSGLQRSAELEQQAQLQKQAELQQAQLKLAGLLLGGDDEQRAQGLAILADPTHPFRMDKEHPKLKDAKNVMAALGSGPGGQAVASGSALPGMTGLTRTNNSPLVQQGLIGDQGSGEGPSPTIPQPSPVGAPPPGSVPNLPPPPSAPPAPPLPPTPAAMTTNPPATQGGKISPAVAAAPPPPPAGLPAVAPPPPAPPAPIEAMLSQFESGLQGHPAVSPDAQKIYHAQKAALATARALQAGGASDAEIRAVLGGAPVTSIENTQTKVGAANTIADKRIAAAESLAKFKATAQQLRDAAKYEQQSRENDLKFAHAQVLKRMGLANAASKDDLKVTWHEIPDPSDPNGMRTVKVPITNATAKEMAAKGEAIQGKVPGLILNRMTSAVAADKRLEEIQKDIPLLLEHIGPFSGQISSFEDLVGSEDPVVRKFLTDRSQVAAYMTSMHGARGAQLMKEFENAAGRLKDNPEAFAAAVQSLRSGTQDFLDTTRSPQVGAPPPGAPGAKAVPGGASTSGTASTPKIGDTKTFKNGNKARWDGTGWVKI